MTDHDENTNYISLSLLFLSFTVLYFNCDRVWKQGRDREGRFGKDPTRNSENEAEFFIFIFNFNFNSISILFKYEKLGRGEELQKRVFVTSKTNKTKKKMIRSKNALEYKVESDLPNNLVYTKVDTS
jgi:hypothetical protein